MFGREKLVAFVASAQPERAIAFYRDMLGLALKEDTPFAAVFDANGVTIRLQKVPELTPQRFTVLGWAVADVRGAVRALMAKGVAFERFEGMAQDELGVWTPPGGAHGVAWFKDPDGNLLSVSGA